MPSWSRLTPLIHPAAHSPIKNPEPAPIAKPNTEDYMSYRRVEAPVSQSGTNAKSTDNELEKMKRELAMVQNKLSQIEGGLDLS